jgi:O-methyltransferase involved in polyketide biosynthesis
MGDAAYDSVSETLFFPLYALSLESRRPDPIIADEGAVELTRRLDESFAGSDRRLYRRLAAGRLPGTLVTALSLRIRHYDRSVREFLEREPDGVVVNLGCGLNDRRRRVDNGRARWFDLDLPPVIALRRRFLDETPRMRFIASSVLDLEWLDALPDEPGHRFLFVAEGLFMYLPADAVRYLVVELRERHPGAELVAEVAARWVVRVMRTRIGRGKFRRRLGTSEDVVYRSGLADSRELEGWAPGIELLGDWTYFDEPEPRLGWVRVYGRVPMLRRSQWTVHYRLGGHG